MNSLIYNTGTVSVSGGSAIVEGNLTGWAVALVEGGVFSCDGFAVPILSVEDDTHLTLAYAWPGANGSGKQYAIARTSSEATARAATWTVDRLGKLAQTPWGVGVVPDGRGTLAQRDALSPMPNDDYCWLRVEVDEPAELYFREGGVWLGPYELRGEPGADSTIPGPAGDGFNPAGAWTSGATYSKNDMVSFGGRSFVSFANGNTGNEPPSSDTDDAYWQFVPAAIGPKGDKGDTGDQGVKGDKGDIGNTGPANTLEIGTVQGGATAGATITGSAPSQTLNLVLPKGDKGDKGDQGIQGLPGQDGTGTGDMQAATYDPSNKAADAFSMGNMVEGDDAKIMTAAERTKLSGIEAAATKNQSDSYLLDRDNHEGKMPLSGLAVSGAARFVIGRTATSGNAGQVAMSADPLANTVALRGTGGVLKVGEPVADDDAAPKEYADKKVTKAGDTGLGGFTASAAADDGTKSSGTYTPDPTTNNWRKIVANGAFNLAAPTKPGCYAMSIDITNGANAGAITFPGFLAGSPKGDSLTTVNGHKFKLHLHKSDVGVTGILEALQ